MRSGVLVLSVTLVSCSDEATPGSGEVADTAADSVSDTGAAETDALPDTAAPAASVVSKPARSVCTTSGERTMRSVTRVAMPSVPSEPTTSPRRSGPSGSSAAPPSSTTSPSGSTSVRPVT